MIVHCTQKLAAKLGAITVLKRGPAGCTIYHQDKKIDVPGFSVTEVDPTGAGDCFSAAFIAGLESGWPLEQVGASTSPLPGGARRPETGRGSMRAPGTQF